LTPGGLCFTCREYTSRYDAESKRWACQACWPTPTMWERVVASISTKPLARIVDPGPDDRQPGETRQEWRRRTRGGEQAATLPSEVREEKSRAAFLELGDLRRADQPWRQRRRR